MSNTLAINTEHFLQLTKEQHVSYCRFVEQILPALESLNFTEKNHERCKEVFDRMRDLNLHIRCDPLSSDDVKQCSSSLLTTLIKELDEAKKSMEDSRISYHNVMNDEVKVFDNTIFSGLTIKHRLSLIEYSHNIVQSQHHAVNITKDENMRISAKKFRRSMSIL